MNLFRSFSNLFNKGVLSPQEIRDLGILSPCLDSHTTGETSAGLSNAGYDLRIKQDLVIPPKGFATASAIEYFKMPDNIVAEVHDKSTLARKGLQAFNTFIEPNWQGYLTLEFINHSNEPISLKAGQGVVLVVFEYMNKRTIKPYNGKYQNQEDRPVGAISSETLEERRYG